MIEIVEVPALLTTFASDTVASDSTNDSAVRNHAHHPLGDAVPEGQGLSSAADAAAFLTTGLSADALELNRKYYLTAFVGGRSCANLAMRVQSSPRAAGRYFSGRSCRRQQIESAHLHSEPVLIAAE